MGPPPCRGGEAGDWRLEAGQVWKLRPEARHPGSVAAACVCSELGIYFYKTIRYYNKFVVRICVDPTFHFLQCI